MKNNKILKKNHHFRRFGGVIQAQNIHPGQNRAYPKRRIAEPSSIPVVRSTMLIKPLRATNHRKKQTTAQPLWDGMDGPILAWMNILGLEGAWRGHFSNPQNPLERFFLVSVELTYSMFEVVAFCQIFNLHVGHKLGSRF